MTDKDIKDLQNDTDGLISYEYMVNNMFDMTVDELTDVVENIARVDLSAQYLASGARYLNALDPERYADQVRRMVALTIDRDREHRYIGDLITAIYGADYAQHATELAANDNNFRRLYKRLYPEGAL